MKTKVLIITNNYPYIPGEEFFEEEIKYWSKTVNTRVLILPLNSGFECREVPESVEVLGLKNTSNLAKVVYLLLGVFSRVFFKEMLFLTKKKILNTSKLYSLICSSSMVEMYKVKLNKIIKSEKVDIVYTYWNTEASYACASLKCSGYIKTLVSRLHGYDIYEERNEKNYIPLKRQYISKFDKLFAISQQGKHYLMAQYNVSKDCIKLARLGVSLPNSITMPSDEGDFHFVSISYCSHVKRVDKIINALALMAIKNTDLQVKWTHIGGGNLLDSLIIQAQEQLSQLPNLNFEFKGSIPNKEVKEFFEANFIDSFINVSESEGVPVSIMEAMSYGCLQ